MSEESTLREVLLVEAHRLVEEAAANAVAKLRAEGAARELSYPPSTEPLQAPAGVPDPDALRAVVADACATTLFNFFALLDGVADPSLSETSTWLGGDIVPPRHDAHRPMLHDAFFDAWSEYVQRTGPAE